MQKKINVLRELLLRKKIDGYIIPSTDEFQNEYTPLHLKRLQFLTGFTGSNGIAIITLKKAAFFTDGRYTLQAKGELDKEFEILDIVPNAIENWLTQVFKKGGFLAYDPMLHSHDNIKVFERIAQKCGFKVKALDGNLVDRINSDNQQSQTATAFELPVKYTGESYKHKIKRLIEKLHPKADFLLLTNPDAISWLLNIRSNQIPFTPLLLAYLLISRKGDILLFTDVILNPQIKTQPLHDLKGALKEVIKNGATIQLDPDKTPVWFSKNIPASLVIYQPDICEKLKAIKNQTEIKGFKDCHLYDGLAVSKFLYWLFKNKNKKITEIMAAKKLLELRQQNKFFQYPSFESISAYGENGAIMHYNANEKSNKIIGTTNLYLIDSGGQYLNGTTDITRTVFLGKKPTSELKHKFTLVLKGHIAIAMARFPKGTTGLHLDAIARYHLWQEGCDYAHGTGHGVGHFLSVHEGPQRIGKTLNCNIALEEGMILSNEPGFYREGRYGIRIENLLLVKKSVFKDFLEFETLTYVPIQGSLIASSILSKAEIEWINTYNMLVYHKLKPYLNIKEQEFLRAHIICK